MAGPVKLVKVVLVGDGGVGKSSLMQRFVSNKFDAQPYHTIGVEFLNKDVMVGGQTYVMQIWDTAGQERFRSLRTPFYRGAEICILTFAVNDRNSFDNLSSWKKEFLYHTDIKDETVFPFVILGNKVDLPDRQVDENVARAWCARNGNLPYFETSAKDSTNVEVAFVSAVSRLLELENQLDLRRVHARTVTLSTSSPSSSFSCCQ